MDWEVDRVGIYINPGNSEFEVAINSPIYVDKTGLAEAMNQLIGTKDRMVCVSRPRRFGKSMAVEMLCAYYDKSCDSRKLFEGLEIAKQEDFEQHLNKHNVIHLDMNSFLGIIDGKTGERITGTQALIEMQEAVIKELSGIYPGLITEGEDYLPRALSEINNQTGEKFIIMIDEWDAVFRENKQDKKAQDNYIMLLRGLFKNAQSLKFLELAYLTGILPIKKYGTESALNNFMEYTMFDSGILAKYVGFTEEEVSFLCEKYQMDLGETKRWYDGYSLRNVGHIYNPRSIVRCIREKFFDSYWTKTGTYDSLKEYISSNFDGLKDTVIELLGGARCELDASTFQNDMVSMQSKDDVLTLLVHLGYLAYDSESGEAYIPNEEIRKEFFNAVKHAKWTTVSEAIRNSRELLEATWDMDNEYVAEALGEMHADATSVLQYNNENSLSCAISIAYYAAKEYYTMFRELPRGRGFADIVYLPNKNVDKPAIVVELKWNESAQGAIDQIREKQYTKHLENYSGEILLVGINYDKKTKVHECLIEKYSK